MNPRKAKRKSRPVDIVVKSGSFRREVNVGEGCLSPCKFSIDTGEHLISVVVKKKVR